VIDCQSLQPDPHAVHLKDRGHLADKPSGTFMQRKPQSGFWYGLCSVLTLQPPKRSARVVTLDGLDLARISTAEALRRDWEKVLEGSRNPQKDTDPHGNSSDTVRVNYQITAKR
jgi:hypothetical protein